MFHEVDAALVQLIRDEALGESDVQISLDVPNRPWFAAVQQPTVNVFLYDVRENLARRDVMHEPVLDEAGRIVGRRPPALRYDLYYLLSVWGAPDPALEHRVLAALLVGIGRYDVFPEDRVPEEHRELGLWHLSVASGMKRMMPGNFGGEMKLQAEVAITVPLPPRIPLPVGPPVDRPMDIRMSGSGGQQEQVQGRPPAPGDPRAGDPRAAGAQGQPVPRQSGPPGTGDPSRQREQLARAVAAGGPGAGGPGAGGPQGPQRPPGAGAPPGVQRRPGAEGPAGTQRTPNQDPMAVLRSALAQAAQAQAALAQAQSLVARAMAGPAAQPRRPAAPSAGPPAAPSAGPPAPPAGPAAAPPAAPPPATPPAAPASEGPAPEG